jgi:hypothetical protein
MSFRRRQVQSTALLEICLEHDAEKPVPHLMRDGYRFSENIMLQQ